LKVLAEIKLSGQCRDRFLALFHELWRRRFREPSGQRRDPFGCFGCTEQPKQGRMSKDLEVRCDFVEIAGNRRILRVDVVPTSLHAGKRLFVDDSELLGTLPALSQLGSSDGEQERDTQQDRVGRL
jgi:hypothetical protein